jgi:citrate lyase beta subunit
MYWYNKENKYMIDVNEIGASLYVPLTKFNPTILFEKYPFIRSVIVDCEDSINEKDVDSLQNMIDLFLTNQDGSMNDYGRLIFLRVRNNNHFRCIKKNGSSSFFHAIVLPKFSHKTGEQFIDFIEEKDVIMPVIETEIFFDNDLKKTMSMIEKISQQILCLRIGANDILGFFGQRRHENSSIYSNPIFSKYFTEIYVEAKRLQLPLSGPVFDYFSKISFSVLDEEVKQELNYGIHTKSAIHPMQVKHIQDNYQVSNYDLISSEQILNTDNPVINFNNAMLEKSIHNNWAKGIQKRYLSYGLKK